MTDTPETRAAIEKFLSRLVGRFGGGFSLAPEYLAEMGRTLRDECPSMAVFRAVCDDLLEIDPTDQFGRKAAPSPQCARILALEHAPPVQRPECPVCGGEGWTHRRVETGNPCAAGQYSVDVAERCKCRAVYRPPKEPENATMADVRGLIGGKR